MSIEKLGKCGSIQSVQSLTLSIIVSMYLGFPPTFSQSVKYKGHLQYLQLNPIQGFL
jgi:hypothetical protein